MLPLIGARDELGDLARSFARLLDEVNAYTDYLRTLASKLSHELQTPLAIVKSSLDNLDHQAVPAEARTYLARARDGAERLGAIVRAMSEASRMERAIVGVEGEDFDLAAVLRGCVEAYGPLAAPRRVDGDIAGRAGDHARRAGTDRTGARQVVRQRAQLRAGGRLDPPVVAARAPTAPKSASPTAARCCRRRCRSACSTRSSACGLGARPPRPAAASARVASARRARADAPHLGLGLYVVRMIADLHRGEARARNLADGSGVEFIARAARHAAPAACGPSLIYPAQMQSNLQRDWMLAQD